MSVPALLRASGPGTFRFSTTTTPDTHLTMPGIRPQLRALEVLLARLEAQVFSPLVSGATDHGEGWEVRLGGDAAGRRGRAGLAGRDAYAALGDGTEAGGAWEELRRNRFLRRKMEFNIEHARTQLLQLEHQLPSVTPQSQRAALAANLSTKRDLIKKMNRRLVELDQLDTSTGEEDEQAEISSAATNGTTRHQEARSSGSATQAGGIQTDQPSATLRARGPNSADSAPSTNTAQTSALFSGRRASPPPSTTSQDRQTLLLAQETEQSRLTTSLISLASALKQSNMSFAASLEDEKGVLDRAVAGLDKNALGMESAGRRMGTLRKMTEGQGWYGRLKLYAIIGALWVVLFLLVFVGPKLRF